MSKFFSVILISLFITVFSNCGASGPDKIGDSVASEDSIQMTTDQLSGSIQSAIASNFTEEDDDPEVETASLDPSGLFLTIGSAATSPIIQKLVSSFTELSFVDLATLATYITANYMGNTAAFWADVHGVLINLEGLPLDLSAISSLITTAFAQNTPVVFENRAMLEDFLASWGQNTASQYTEHLASLLGLGVDAQVVMAVPELLTESNLVKIYTLGINLLSELGDDDDGDNDGEEGTPIEGDSIDDENSGVSINTSSTVEQGGYPANSPSSVYYKSYEVSPWKKTYWKPDSSERQDFRNSIYYKIQLTWDEKNSKKYLRVFTLNKGGFRVPDTMLENRMDARGYFMYQAKISIYPVNSNDKYSWPSWLQTCDTHECIAPLTHAYRYTDYPDRLYSTIYYRNASGSGEGLQRIVENEIAGFTVYTYSKPHYWLYQEKQACNADLRMMNEPDPAKYFYDSNDLKDARKVCSKKHMEFSNNGMQKNFHTTDAPNKWENWKVDIGGNADWFKDSINKRPHMPVFRARVGFTPLVMLTMWVDDTINYKKRFILKSYQYAKMVYRSFGIKTKTHSNKKYRHFTVDLSKVGN